MPTLRAVVSQGTLTRQGRSLLSHVRATLRQHWERHWPDVDYVLVECEDDETWSAALHDSATFPLKTPG